MESRKKAVLGNLVLGALIAALVVALTWETDGSLWHKLCDGFFVAAVLLMGVGGIRAVANTGSFDVMGYSMKVTVQTFLPMLNQNPLGRQEEDFLTYKERKEQGRKPYADLLIAGGVYLALAVVFLIVNYQAM